MKFLFLSLILISLTLAQVCEDGETEACEPSVGICAGSTRTCFEGIWGACSILPKEEICDNNADDNCDGLVDENCVCTEGETRECETFNLGICSSSTQICENNQWSPCDILPEPEICDNSADDDCDGLIDSEDEDCFNENHCRNSIQDFDEEDIDCGGSLCFPCPTCKDGKLSSKLGETKISVILEDGTVSDCGGLCPSCPTCSDGKKNQNEQEVDCGGPNCPSCDPVEDTTPTNYCGDNTCDSDEDSISCPEDCESDSNFLLYLFIILILLVVLFIFFIFLTKRGKRKKKQPPLKIHSAFFKPLATNTRSDQLAEKLKKIK